MRGTTVYAVVAAVTLTAAVLAPHPVEGAAGKKVKSEKKKEKVDSGLVFESPTIHTFTIVVSGADWEKMTPQEPQRIQPGPFGLPPVPMESEFEYGHATVQLDRETYRDVGLRFKGHSSYRGSGLDSIRKPYKMDFDKFVDRLHLHGFRKLNFSNAFKDPSLLREKIAYDLFAQAGVAAPRASFAKLYLTIPGKFEKQYAGLYTMVEQVDSVFLKDRFGNSKGLLVKVETMGDLPYRGDEWSRYARDYELERGETSDTRVLTQFLQFLHQSPDRQFAAEIEQRLNVEGFLAQLAVNTLLSNLDSYGGTGHNFYLYHNPTTGRFEVIPWDLNEAFGSFAMGTPDEMMNLDIYRPFAGKRDLIERLLTIERYRERYRATLKQLIAGPFAPHTMNAEIDRLHAFIRADALADTLKPYSNEEFKRSLTENIGGKMPFPKPPFALPEKGPGQPGSVPGGPPPGGMPGGMPPGGMPGGPPMGPPVGPPAMFVAIGLKPFVAKRVESVRDQLEAKRRGYMIPDRGGPGGPFPPGPMPGAFPPGGPPPDMPFGPDPFAPSPKR